jgi:hypothetical protein
MESDTTIQVFSILSLLQGVSSCLLGGQKGRFGHGVVFFFDLGF